jgi:hypothetical protein
MSTVRLVVRAALIVCLGLMPHAIGAQTSAPPAPAITESAATKPEWRQRDESAELEGLGLLIIESAFAVSLATDGPLSAYQELISPEGILHDASGASPEGPAGAQARFGNFPADVRFERKLEDAVASGDYGTSWGSYVIKKGDQALSVGRYISVWRLEEGEWRLYRELAAGRAGQQAATAAGPLPRRPPTLGQSPDQSVAPVSPKP